MSLQVKDRTANILSVMGCVGQQTVGPARPPGMSSWRPQPCDQFNTTDIESYGFIVNNLKRGIQHNQMFPASLTARASTAVANINTSDPGYQMRVNSKRHEDLKVNEGDYSVRDAVGRIITFAYGRDYGSREFRVRCTVPDAKMADQDFRTKHGGAALKARRELSGVSEVYTCIPLDWIYEWMCGGVDKRVDMTEWAGIHQSMKSLEDSLKTQVGRDDEVGQNAVRVLCSMIMVCFSRGRLVGKCSTERARELRARLHRMWTHTLVAPGENVGIIGAHSIYRVLIQLVLDTFHNPQQSAATVLQMLRSMNHSKVRNPNMSMRVAAGQDEAAKVAAVCNLLEHVKIGRICHTATWIEPEDLDGSMALLGLPNIPAALIIDLYKITQPVLMLACSSAGDRACVTRAARSFLDHMSPTVVECDTRWATASLLTFEEAIDEKTKAKMTKDLCEATARGIPGLSRCKASYGKDGWTIETKGSALREVLNLATLGYTGIVLDSIRTSDFNDAMMVMGVEGFHRTFLNEFRKVINKPGAT